MKFVYTDWHRQLGDRLREARLDAGYSLQQVGTALGFSWQMLQRFEVATARLHADSADELALFYGVDVRWLLGSVPEPHSNSSQGGLMAPLLDVLPATSVAGIRGVPSISF
jgi:transcriptional regulator with XRE-family HTH domain